MRRLTYLILVLAALYGGYWFVGSRAVESGAVAALDQLQTNGAEVAYESLNTTGFPSRFDTTLTNARLHDPATGWGWEGEFLQVFALSYQPNKVIVIAPPTQTILSPMGQIVLRAEGLRASAAVGLSAGAPLADVIVESGAGTLAPQGQAEVGFTKFLAALRPTDVNTVYAVFAEVLGIALPGVSDKIETLKVDGTVTLSRQLDRHIGTGEPPLIESITLADSSIAWGGGVLTGTGTLTVDAAGYPVGEIALSITGWEAMIDAAVNAGLVAPEHAPQWIGIGAFMANGATTIEMPLIFAPGQISLGSFPLGPALRLR